MNPSYNNNSFGNFNAPINSGDIVLQSQPNKTKKILPVILAGVVVLLLVIVLAVVILVRREASTVAADQYLEKYANLLVNGELVENYTATKIDKNELENATGDNIYILTRQGDPLSEKNIGYYKSLEEALNGVQGSISRLAISEDRKQALSSLVNESKMLTKLYFVSTALVYTNATYDYYFEKGNFDGLLEEYGYPFNEEYEGIAETFQIAIDELYDSKLEYYRSLAQAGCQEDGSFDYECVNGGAMVEESRNRMATVQAVLGRYADMMFDIIMRDENNMYELLGGDKNE